MISWFQREIIGNDRLALFLCFLAFIATFLVTRMIRAGRGPFKNNVSEGGLHVHHAVPGVILLSIGAFVAVGTGSAKPWAEIAGVLVGIGMSLVLDEFALILHLNDVYWGDEGRISVELVSLAIACVGLVLLGVNPFADTGQEDTLHPAVRIPIVIGAVAIHVLLVAVCVMKGKYRLALLGFFIPIIVDISTFRLARPGSRWAKRRYETEKMEKAVRRAAKWDRRFGPITRWINDTLGGKPTTTEPTTTAP